MDKNYYMYGISETKIIKDLQEVQKELDKTKAKYTNYIDSVLTAAKEYNEKLSATNPYKSEIEAVKKEQEELTVNVGYYRDAMEKRLAVDKWYSQEYQKLKENKNNFSPAQQKQSMADLDTLYDMKYAEADEQVWQQRGEKIGSVFGRGLSDIITEYDQFDKNMRNMAKNLADFLIQESLRAITQQLFATKQMQSIIGALNTGSKKGGFLGAAFNIIKGVGKRIGIPTFHDGGVVPVGANAELQGTQEQLALLKGGERILSPGENASYNSNDSQNSPVIFNNFNIKAWDSKDVRKYLLENKQLLNQITFQGIKDNNSQLRTMVRNA